MSRAARPPFAEVQRGLLRDTVLDAVGELLRERSWPQVTMAQVAGQAGVSRQTLYNAFGSRAELARSYVGREAERFLGAVADAIRSRAEDPREALREGLSIFLNAVEVHPLARAVVASEEGDELLTLVTTRGGPVLGTVTEGLAAVIGETWPQVPEEEIRLLADSVVRLAISHAALPADEPRRTAANLARLLGPYVDERLARAGRV